MESRTISNLESFVSDMEWVLMKSKGKLNPKRKAKMNNLIQQMRISLDSLELQVKNNIIGVL